MFPADKTNCTPFAADTFARAFATAFCAAVEYGSAPTPPQSEMAANAVGALGSDADDAYTGARAKSGRRAAMDALAIPVCRLIPWFRNAWLWTRTLCSRSMFA